MSKKSLVLALTNTSVGTDFNNLIWRYDSDLVCEGTKSNKFEVFTILRCTDTHSRYKINFSITGQAIPSVSPVFRILVDKIDFYDKVERNLVDCTYSPYSPNNSIDYYQFQLNYPEEITSLLEFVLPHLIDLIIDKLLKETISEVMKEIE